jgi:hypothetical protein
VSKLAIALTVLVGLVLGARTMMHAASASYPLEDGAVARMDLWYTFAEGDSGAHLYVCNWLCRNEIKIDTWDWAHWIRTSLYRTPNGKIAVVHPFGGRPTHLVPLSWGVVETWDWQAADADAWTYLGAFDWRGQNSPGGRDRRFDFIPSSEQRECIPMGGLEKKQSYQPRSNYQRDSCPSP